MNPLEQQVWAAAFANEYARLLASQTHHAVFGTDAARHADFAVLKMREALCGPNSPDHLPEAENWSAVEDLGIPASRK